MVLVARRAGPSDDRPASYAAVAPHALGRMIGEMFAGMLEAGMPLDVACEVMCRYVTALAVQPKPPEAPAT